jgi:hypothetical protein
VTFHRALFGAELEQCKPASRGHRAPRGTLWLMPRERERDPDERVSLHGLEPEEALRALLAVDPDAEPVDGEQVASPVKPQPEQD